MKQESTVKFVLRIAITLLLITGIVAAALAVVNQVTAPIIAQLKAEKTQQAIMAVLPGGYDTELSAFPDDTGLVAKVYQGASGYAVEVNPIGFDSAITMMVGVDYEGKVLGFEVISHKETKGLGEVAASKNSAGVDFRSQFVGMSGTLAVTKDGGQVDAIAGATVTSRAICVGINAALACVAGLG